MLVTNQELTSAQVCFKQSQIVYYSSFNLTKLNNLVISKDSKKRIHSIIASSEKEGAKVLLDGRECKVEKYPNGNFVGPTILGDVKVS